MQELAVGVALLSLVVSLWDYLIWRNKQGGK